MKLRIQDDSIRLRLDRAEVDRVGGGETIAASTHFPDGANFVYALSCADLAEPGAQFAAGRLEVHIPTKEAADWAADATAVAITNTSAQAEGTLNILVEKDFECLEPRAGEDQTNRFTNPKAVR